jgi:hypothetical protein
MAGKTEREPKWRDWLAPGVAAGIVTAVVTWQLSGMGARFTAIDNQYADLARRLTDLDAKLDRRVDALAISVKDTNTRIDSVLLQQTTMSAQLGRAEAELAYIRGRVDRVAEKLQVTGLQLSPVPITPTNKDSPNAPLNITPTAEFQGLNITRQQVQTIRESLKKTTVGSTAPPADVVEFAFSAEIGGELPNELLRFSMPVSLDGKNYQAMILSRKLTIIDPKTRKIVGIFD